VRGISVGWRAQRDESGNDRRSSEGEHGPGKAAKKPVCIGRFRFLVARDLAVTDRIQSIYGVETKEIALPAQAKQEFGRKR